MPKRYQGNSGRFSWVEPPPRPAPERPPGYPPGRTPVPPPDHAPGRPPEQRPGHMPGRPPGRPGAPEPPGFSLLPKLLGELETEDLILLLLCYLLYRESGDSDWLIVLGALLLA